MCIQPPVKLAIVQIYSFENNTWLLTVDLMCLVIAGRSLPHAYCTVHKRPTFQRRLLQTNQNQSQFECLGLYQVCPLASLQAPAPWLKASLRTTRIFSGVSFAAGLCHTCTRDSSHPSLLILHIHFSCFCN